jgi:hypothetical protein
MVHLATVSPDADPMPRSVDPSVDALSHATTLRMCARFRKEHFTGRYERLTHRASQPLSLPSSGVHAPHLK